MGRYDIWGQGTQEVLIFQFSLKALPPQHPSPSLWLEDIQMEIPQDSPRDKERPARHRSIWSPHRWLSQMWSRLQQALTS